MSTRPPDFREVELGEPLEVSTHRLRQEIPSRDEAHIERRPRYLVPATLLDEVLQEIRIRDDERLLVILRYFLEDGDRHIAANAHIDHRQTREDPHPHRERIDEQRRLLIDEKSVFEDRISRKSGRRCLIPVDDTEGKDPRMPRTRHIRGDILERSVHAVLVQFERLEKTLLRNDRDEPAIRIDIRNGIGIDPVFLQDALICRHAKRATERAEDLRIRDMKHLYRISRRQDIHDLPMFEMIDETSK